MAKTPSRRSRLALTTLGDLLGALYRSGARGTLELVEDKGPFAGRAHRLHVDDGRLRLIESPLGAERLGELLVEERLITRAMHYELLANLEDDPSTPTGKRVIERHWVEPIQLGKLAHEQANRRLLALYQLRDARVAFRIARPIGEQLVANIPLTAEEFLHGRPRARDRNSAPEVQSPSSYASESPCADPRRRRALLLLGLPPHADTSDVKRAFRRIASRLHPDRHLVLPERQQELAKQRFAQMSEAYHLLTG